MRDTNRIAELIFNSLKGKLNANIVGVEVSDHTNSDGELVLDVKVVYDGSADVLNPSELATAVRHVRAELNDEGVEAFPLFSFVSKEDISEGWLRSA